MNNKTTSHHLMVSSYLIVSLYCTGMLGVVFTSVYHIFYESRTSGVSTSLALTILFFIFILASVILAKFNKAYSGQSKKDLFLKIFTIVIICALFVLILLSAAR